MTSDAGRNEDKSPRYASISGSSAAAALVGGAAALVAAVAAGARGGRAEGRARRYGGAASRRRPSPRRAPASSIRVRLRRRRWRRDRRQSASAPPTRSAGGRGGRSPSENVSTRRLPVTVASEVEGIAGVSVRAKPNRLRLAPGESATGRARRASRVPASQRRGRHRSDTSGRGRRRPGRGFPGRSRFRRESAPLLGQIRLSTSSFRASDRAPAVLSVRAGSVTDRAGRMQLRPLARLDVELWRGQRSSACSPACATCSRAATRSA